VSVCACVRVRVCCGVCFVCVFVCVCVCVCVWCVCVLASPAPYRVFLVDRLAMAWYRSKKSKGNGVQDRMHTARQVAGDEVRMQNTLPGGELLWFIYQFFLGGAFFWRLEGAITSRVKRGREGGREGARGLGLEFRENESTRMFLHRPARVHTYKHARYRQMYSTNYIHVCRRKREHAAVTCAYPLNPKP
jgi:hypothetical protein